MNNLSENNFTNWEDFERLDISSQIDYLILNNILNTDYERKEIEELIITAYAIKKLTNKRIFKCIMFLIEQEQEEIKKDLEIKPQIEEFIETTANEIDNIVSPNYQTIETVEEENNIIDIELKNKYEYIGQLIEGFRKVSKNGKFGFLDENKNEIIKCIYDDVEDFSNSHAIIYLEGKGYGFINILGEIVSKCKYSEVLPFIEGIAPINLGKKRGYINESGIEKKEILFDDVNEIGGEYIFKHQLENYKFNKIHSKLERFQ